MGRMAASRLTENSMPMTEAYLSVTFCWVDSDPLKMHEWAQAGRTLSVLPKDWWWSALKEDQLKFQVSYPGAKREHDRIRNEKWDEECGDKRQELVFIGGPQMSEDEITLLLDECLVSDDELVEYLPAL